MNLMAAYLIKTNFMPYRIFPIDYMLKAFRAWLVANKDGGTFTYNDYVITVIKKQ